MLHDSHTHLYLLEDIEAVVSDAKNRGLRAILTCGEDFKTSRKCVEISEEFGCVYPAVGVHPCSEKDGDIGKLVDKAVAVGEIGLDGKKGSAHQEKTFMEMLEIAENSDLPVIIHSREAYKRVFEILETFEGKVVLHWFSGPLSLVVEGVNRGYFFSFGPWILKYRVYSAYVDLVPFDRILLETDTPVGGAKPADVAKVCEKISDIKGCRVDYIIEKTWSNSKRVFGW